MENNKNILLSKVPDRLSNIVKGTVLIIVSLPVVLFTWLGIVFSGFGGDVQGPNHDALANVVAGGIFIIFLTFGILVMAKPVTSATKRKVFISAFFILIIIILFSGIH